MLYEVMWLSWAAVRWGMLEGGGGAPACEGHGNSATPQLNSQCPNTTTAGILHTDRAAETGCFWLSGFSSSPALSAAKSIKNTRL